MGYSTDQYKTILSDLIKKQMAILGPMVAISTATKVGGMALDSSGIVTDVLGDPETTLSSLTNAYTKLSGEITKNTLKDILEKRNYEQSSS